MAVTPILPPTPKERKGPLEGAAKALGIVNQVAGLGLTAAKTFGIGDIPTADPTKGISSDPKLRKFQLFERQLDVTDPFKRNTPGGS